MMVVIPVIPVTDSIVTPSFKAKAKERLKINPDSGVTRF
jgi:hypothetical protein